MEDFFMLKLLLAIGWTIASTILVLPYQLFKVFFPDKKPGRPGSHPISKFFRKAFESKRAGKFVGAGLTAVLIFSGLLNKAAAANESLSPDQTLINQPISQVLTLTSLSQPLNGVRAQGFHALHHGLDILAPLETAIKPIDAGKVIEVSFGRIGWGNTIVIEHSHNLRSRYAHMNEILVIEGQEINKDTVLGSIGMTGWTTGPHLHLEVYQNGWAIDPESVLPAVSL